MNKILSWEFWPYWIFYTPVYLSFPYFWLRSGSLTFFTAANPSMRHGGLINYSKTESQRHIPARYLPATIYYRESTTLDKVLDDIAKIGISFPLIAKPDKGERGYNVHIVESPSALQSYLSQLNHDIIIQEYVDAPLEFGIMYHRFPDQGSGSITSIVKKESLTVIGDGRSSILELISNDERCARYEKVLQGDWGSELERIPQSGEVIHLNKVGNHSRGAVFRNGNHLVTPDLIRVFDEITSKMEGFHIGRFDVRAASFAHLEKGEFKIIEVNGVNSEPAHIYDPDNTLFSAYRDLVRHWNLVARISSANIRDGKTTDTLSSILASIREHLSRKKAIQVSVSG